MCVFGSFFKDTFDKHKIYSIRKNNFISILYKYLYKISSKHKKKDYKLYVVKYYLRANITQEKDNNNFMLLYMDKF